MAYGCKDSLVKESFVISVLSEIVIKMPQGIFSRKCKTKKLK